MNMNNLSKLLMSSALCTVCTIASAQQVNVNGIVKDATGETVIGASVMVKGTKTGTVTDFDGNFHVECAPGSTLIISYIGYKTQEVKASDNMEVTLQEDANDLQEVVVTGYTTQKKADLTGSVAVVSTKNLKTSSETDPMRALQGRVPGMTVTTDGSPIGSGTVRIRGIGSFNSSQDPLYIIDGVPTNMALNTLNTNDIESMQVLKDAASASIYGSRASNGVIIITTKKGKKGSKVAVDCTVLFQPVEDEADELQPVCYCDGSGSPERWTRSCGLCSQLRHRLECGLWNSNHRLESCYQPVSELYYQWSIRRLHQCQEDHAILRYRLAR